MRYLESYYQGYVFLVSVFNFLGSVFNFIVKDGLHSCSATTKILLVKTLINNQINVHLSAIATMYDKSIALN